MAPQVKIRNPKTMQIKVYLRSPIAEQFIRMRDNLAEDNAGLARIAIRDYLERHNGHGQPVVMPGGQEINVPPQMTSTEVAE